MFRVLTLLVTAAALWGHEAHAQPVVAPSSRPTTIEPAPGPELEILYTGRTGGVAGQSGSGATILQLWRHLSERKGEASLDRTGHGVLRHGRRIIIDPDNFKAAPNLALISQGPRSAQEPRHMTALQSEKILFFQYPPNPRLDLLQILEQENRRSGNDPSLRRVQVQLTELRTRGGERILAIDIGAGSPGELPRDPRHWELRWGGRGSARLGDQRASYYMLPQPYAAGAQRVQLLKNRRAALGKRPSLLVSAGNEVDDWDSSTGKISRFRSLDLQNLAELSYAAVIPGYRELYFGAQHLAREARKHRIPLVATNLLRVRDKKGKNKSKGKKGAKNRTQHETIFHRYLLRTIGGIKVAILGLVDPRVVERVQSPEKLTGVKIADPLNEATQVILDLQRLPPSERPDLVVAVSNLKGDAKEAFLKECFGIDIFIGDFSQRGIYAAAEEINVATRRRENLMFRYPLLQTHGSYARVGQIRASFKRGSGQRPELARLLHQQHAIHAEVPRDVALQHRVMGLLLKDLPQRESVLIPSLEKIVRRNKALLRMIHEDPQFVRLYPRGRSEKWQIWFTPRLWSNLLANLLRYGAGTDVALIKATSHLNYNTPGPVIEEYVNNWLSSNELVERLELTGAQLRALVTSGLEGLVLTGLDRATMKVGGRPLTNDERYSVAMGRSAAETPSVARLMQGIPAQRQFRLEGHRLIPSGEGRATRLREVALAVLKELRRADPGFSPAYLGRLRTWLRPMGAELEPRWTIHADNLTFSFSSYGNYPREGYTKNPGVRETRVVMPNHYSLALKGTIAAAYDTRGLTWDSRVLFKLSQQMITTLDDAGAEQSSTIKMADDLQLSTELRLKILEIPLGSARRLQLIPYANFTFDTEFAPTTSMITGETYPHQKDLLSSAGLVTFPGGVLKEVRLAGVLRTDLAADTELVDGGLMLGAKILVPIWLARLRLGGTLFFYPDTDRDTPDKLGLILQSTANLDVPFTRDLKVTLGADLFLYRAKVRHFTDDKGVNIDRDVAASLILSAGVAFDHLWKL